MDPYFCEYLKISTSERKHRNIVRRNTYLSNLLYQASNRLTGYFQKSSHRLRRWQEESGPMQLAQPEQRLHVGETTYELSGLKALEPPLEAVIKYSAAEWPIAQEALFAVSFEDFESRLQGRRHLRCSVEAFQWMMPKVRGDPLLFVSENAVQDDLILLLRLEFLRSSDEPDHGSGKRDDQDTMLPRTSLLFSSDHSSAYRQDKIAV